MFMDVRIQENSAKKRGKEKSHDKECGRLGAKMNHAGPPFSKKPTPIPTNVSTPMIPLENPFKIPLYRLDFPIIDTEMRRNLDIFRSSS